MRIAHLSGPALCGLILVQPPPGRAAEPKGRNAEPIVIEWKGAGNVRVTLQGEMTIGDGGPPRSIARAGLDFDELLARFAPFEQQTSSGKLLFRGHGTVADPAWRRAILYWIRAMHEQAVSGHACSACHTGLSYLVVDATSTPNRCGHLTVPWWGYAYAETHPCVGDPVPGADRSGASVEGWLETSEWVRLEDWLTHRSPTYWGDNYLSGVGSRRMSEDEKQRLAELAQAVYRRLVGAQPGQPRSIR